MVKGLIAILAAIGLVIAAAFGPNLIDLPVAPPGDDPLLSPLPRPPPGV
jgi:hypothetical protein